MKKIPLTRGKVALVDDADFDWLNHYRWRAQEKCSGNFYATRHALREAGEKRRTVGMHQIIAAIMGFERPDHIDGNGLNNQRGNLRPATKSENGANRKLNRNNTSGFKGVGWNKAQQKWTASIRQFGKLRYLGYFLDVMAAARAYDVAAKEIFGKFARLNFPE